MKVQYGLRLGYAGMISSISESYVYHMSPPRLATESSDELIRPRKLINPVLESPSHRKLHGELLLSHRRGLLPGGKPELQRVLEQRRLEQDREQERARRPPSDLEQELHKRKQRLLEYEREEMRLRLDRENIPEFVRVKDNLRHIQVAGN
ncbi:protein FAM107B-like [Megalops cyprinoides]|uniref:protein FAM107B-like n=1 Tax=Megalops cyprinoides TaxID=118141 RepID=UPI0018640462|nr:protein FAM107B-like [Megalops cyprinoides]